MSQKKVDLHITSAEASHKPIILHGSHFVLCYPNRVACLMSTS
jgi:hypothetical protein